MKTTLVIIAALAVSGLTAGTSTDTVKGQPAAAKNSKTDASYRGFTFPVSADQLINLKRGDRVDVLMTYVKNSENRKEKVTVTILQNVRVINVKKPEKKGGPGAVEILCNPEEAQHAALGGAAGEIHLAVRAPGDEQVYPLEEASFRKLFK